MNADPQILAAVLDDYEAALTRQIALLRGELGPLQRSWGALSAVYEGTAAEQFRAGWISTERMLEDYLTTAERLRPLLRERLEALRQAGDPDPSAP